MHSLHNLHCIHFPADIYHDGLQYTSVHHCLCCLQTLAAGDIEMFIRLKREPDPTHPMTLCAEMPLDALTQHFQNLSGTGYPTCCPGSPLWQEALQRRKKQLLYGSQKSHKGDAKK